MLSINYNLVIFLIVFEKLEQKISLIKLTFQWNIKVVVMYKDIFCLLCNEINIFKIALLN